MDISILNQKGNFQVSNLRCITGLSYIEKKKKNQGKLPSSILLSRNQQHQTLPLYNVYIVTSTIKLYWYQQEHILGTLELLVPLLYYQSSSNWEMMLAKTRYPWDISVKRQYSFLAWYVAIRPEHNVKRNKYFTLILSPIQYAQICS